MVRHNCWDIKKCGREKGGAKVSELGICPAAADQTSDGVNNGHAGGRVCWAIAGTLCEGKVQGTFAEKERACSDCEVFRKVRQDEGVGFRMFPHRQSALTNSASKD